MDHGTLGDWELLDELGRGGMGIVYRARRLHDGQLAALKTVHGTANHHADALRREIRALARLHHPGLPEVLAEGVDDDRAWYAMTLIEAPDLAACWSGDTPTTSATFTVDLDALAPLPATRPTPSTTGRDGWARWTRTMAQLAAALSHVHGAGLVHGDLKPGNVLVPTLERPVLVDFGLTLKLRGRDDLDRVAASARSRGTPAYLAPERGSGQPWDLRADLYSLGCMLYEWVTGAPPFVGGASDLVRQHRRAHPVPVQQRVPDLPEHLVTLIMALLAKDPRDRPSDAAVVARALGQDVPDGPTPLFRPRLHGRDEEQRQLMAALAAACEGHGSAWCIQGDAGAGKTRLALSIVRAASRQQVRCLTAAAAPVAAPTGRTRSLPAQLVEAAAERVRQGDRIEDWFGDDLDWLAPRFPVLHGMRNGAGPSPPDALTATAAQQRLVARLRAIVHRLGATPLLVFLDDLPWADAPTRTLVESLADDPADRVFVLVTARVDAPVPLGLTTLPLPPLDTVACEAILGDMLGRPPDPVHGAVVPAAEGSPYLLGEALRAVLGGATDLRPDALTRRRVDWQRAGDRRVLRWAAHLGPLAAPTWLARACQLSLPQVLDATRRLEQEELVFLTPGGVVAFGHRRVADVVRERWPVEADREALRQLAEVIDTDGQAADGALAELWYRAGRPDRARPLFLREATERLAHYALQEAEHALVRAAERDAPSREATRAAERLAREVWLPVGEAARARDLLESHVADLDVLHDEPLAVDVRLALASAHQVLGDYARASAAAEAAETGAIALGDNERRALAIAAAATVATVTGDLDGAEAAFRRGLDHVDSGDAAFTLQRGRTLALWHLHRNEDAIAAARDLQGIAAHTSRYNQADATFVAGLVDMEVPAFPGAMERAFEQFRALGAHRKAALCLGNLAGTACAEGRFADAVAPLQQSIETLRSFHDGRSVALTQLNLAFVQESLSRHADAKPTYRAALRTLERLEDGQRARALVGLSRCGRVLGHDPAEAAGWLDRAAATQPAAMEALMIATERVAWAHTEGAAAERMSQLQDDVQAAYAAVKGHPVAEAQMAMLDEWLAE